MAPLLIWTRGSCDCILQVNISLQVREQRTGQERERAEGRANILVEFEKYGLKVLVGGNLGNPAVFVLWGMMA